MISEPNQIEFNQERINETFNYLFNSTYKNIVRYLKKNGASQSEAEDCFQEGIKKVIVQTQKGKLNISKNELEKYFWRVCQNEYKTIAKHSLLKVYIDPNFEVLDGSLIKEKDFELIKSISEKVISLMGHKCRELIIARIINKKKHKEIAEELNTNEENIKKRFQRCLTDLYKSSEFLKLKNTYLNA